MAISIKVGDAAKAPSVKLELDIRRSMNGDLMVFDHGDIDIILSPSKNKVVAFPKDTMSDLVYGAQNRLFNFLTKKGLVLPESVHAGSFYGAIEAKMEKPYSNELSTPKMTLINISKFIDEERPYFEATEAIISMSDDELIKPDKEDSTELGEVPQRVSQGSISKGLVRDPYSLNYLYTI
tara:strand:+ start:319 stop:858 length:540 start_codon:yes stop_codon:yes gene_type:complete